MSLIWGDAVAAIDQRTTAIQDELRPIRATAEALGQQIAALPEQQRQALAAQTEAIRTHIEQLEKTAQDATTDAFAHAQTQISELRTQLTALSEQVARDTAENQQRLTALESGQVAMHTELTSNHAELCRHIETIDERLIGLEQRITGQLGQIAILCARRSAITFPLTGYLATINAHPFRSHSLFPSATIQEMFRTSTRALPDNRSSSKDESACHFNA